MGLLDIFRKTKKRNDETEVTDHNVTDSHETTVDNNAEKAETTDRSLAGFHKAITDGDAAKAEKELRCFAENCTSRNSYCLSELFCPECPLSGEMPVQNYKYGHG